MSVSVNGLPSLSNEGCFNSSHVHQVLNIFFGKNIGDEDGDAIGDQLQQCMEVSRLAL